MQATGDNYQPSAAAFVRKGCLGICPTGSSNTRLAGFCLHSKTRPARPGLLSSRPFSLAPTDDPGGLATLPRTYTLHINPFSNFLLSLTSITPRATASGVRSAEKKGGMGCGASHNAKDAHSIGQMCKMRWSISQQQIANGERDGMLACCPVQKLQGLRLLLTDDGRISASHPAAPPQSLPPVPSDDDEIRLPPCVARRHRAGACRLPLCLPGKIRSPGCVGPGRRVGDGLLLQPPGD